MHKFILNSIQVNQSNYIDLCSPDLRIRLLNLIPAELLVINIADVSHGVCWPKLWKPTRRAECTAFLASATEAEQSDLRSTSDTALLLLLGFAHGLFFSILQVDYLYFNFIYPPLGKVEPKPNRLQAKRINLLNNRRGAEWASPYRRAVGA
jgi:hypothetical protein